MKISLEVKDHGLLKRLKTMRGVWIPESMEQGLEEFTEEVIAELIVYPPLSEANNPPPPFYERGVGYYGRSGKLTKPSQQLDERWNFETRYGKDHKEVIIRNMATYSGYVQDEDYQTPFHAARGWKTAQTVVREKTGDDGLIRKLQHLIDGFISKL